MTLLVHFSNTRLMQWLIGVPLLYFTLLVSFRVMDIWKFRTWKGSRASDIMAFEIVAILIVCYLGGAGIIGEFGLFGVDEYSHLVEDKFYGRSEYVENHLVVHIIFKCFHVILLLYLLNEHIYMHVIV